MDKTEYNNEPVFYCKDCLSLKIRYTGKLDFCDKCCGTNVAQCSIEEWEIMYKHKYGINYLKK